MEGSRCRGKLPSHCLAMLRGLINVLQQTQHGIPAGGAPVGTLEVLPLRRLQWRCEAISEIPRRWLELYMDVVV